MAKAGYVRKTGVFKAPAGWRSAACLAPADLATAAGKPGGRVKKEEPTIAVAKVGSLCCAALWLNHSDVRAD